MAPGPGSGLVAEETIRKLTKRQAAEERFREAEREYLDFLSSTSIHESAAIMKYAILRDKMDAAAVNLAIERRHENGGPS